MTTEVNLEALSVASHWADRIRVEFIHSEELQRIADELIAGNVREIYESYSYMLAENITDVPEKPVTLYFLKELVADLHRLFEK